ncbi:EamA family transporter RarD [Spongisporangium articulatum]|uniref:EamA family transporter RarD n=1 Tax=Spongisporangium articulatum TaxID=3362603 RepID=A0ABW8ANS1_9ACTN
MNSKGVLYGFGAYFLWGAFPLYFRLLEDSSAFEVLLHRVVWSVLACLVLVVALRHRRELTAVLAQPRRVATLGAAAAVLAVNWGVYIYAVNSGQVIEAALGYFINPLITVALGVLVLRERLRRLQWAAVVVGSVAVAVLTVDYGRLPYIALILAFSFGAYGLIKNRVGGQVSALVGLTTETLTLTPLALVGLVVLSVNGSQTFTSDPPWQGLLLVSTGLVTIAPLLLFAASASRVPLTTLGLLQYVTPTLQFLCGVTVLGEHMPLSRWLGFGLVWAALVLLTADTLRTARASGRAARAAEVVEPLPA